MRATQRGEARGRKTWWRGPIVFAVIQGIAVFDLPMAREINRDALTALSPRQRRNGTFGGPFEAERVAAVLVAVRALGSEKD